MNLPPTLERRARIQFGIAVGVLVICAGVLGWRAGQPSAPPAAVIAKDPWSLGSLKSEDTSKDMDLLKIRRSWDGFDRGRGPAQAQARARGPAVTWRLAGIVKRGDESFVLISTGQAQTAKYEYRRVGDSLPDGSILVQIMPDGAKTQAPPADARAKSDSAKKPSSSSDTHVYRLFNQNP